MPKKLGKRRGKQQQLVRTPPIPLPPTIPPIFRGSTVIRYVKTATGSATVVWRSLAALWVVALSGTTGLALWDAIKLKKIVMWCPPTVSTSAGGFLQSAFDLTVVSAAADVSTTNSVFALDRTFTSTPSERGAMISFSAKDTIFGQWMNAQNLISNANSAKLFYINGPTGSFVDLHVSYQLGFTSSAAYAGVVGAGATASRVYLNYLDSMTITGTAGSQLLQCFSAGGGNTTIAWN